MSTSGKSGSSLRRAEITGHRLLNGWFTPTHLELSSPEGKPATWNSRRSRKGRYSPKAHVVGGGPASGAASKDTGVEESKLGSAERAVYMRVKTVEGELKPHLMLDITFWVAVAFTFGSAVWVVNGFIVWFPILYPDLDTDAFTNTAAATAFIGGTVFEVGSYLMVVEALDRGRETSFGTALGRLLHHRRQISPLMPQASSKSRSSALATHNGSPDRRSAASDDTRLGENDPSSEKQPQEAGDAAGGAADTAESSRGAKGFVWWGKPLWHDLGYLAAFVQLIAATVFWISTLTGLPGVIPGLYDDTSSLAIVDVFYWTPQGFIISSLILMLEVQRKWYIPNLIEIGWWVAVWNLVGAVGFTLCGALGYSASDGAVYQSALSTWWGSWGFLIGSGAQLWEAIWREPREEDQNGPDDGKGA